MAQAISMSMSSPMVLGFDSGVNAAVACSSSSIQPGIIVRWERGMERSLTSSRTRGACIGGGVFIPSRSPFGANVGGEKGPCWAFNGFGFLHCPSKVGDIRCLLGMLNVGVGGTKLGVFNGFEFVNCWPPASEVGRWLLIVNESEARLGLHCVLGWAISWSLGRP